MGEKEGQVPLTKLADHIKKLPKTLQPNQITDIKQRLRALDAVRPAGADAQGPDADQRPPGQGRASGDARPLSAAADRSRPGRHRRVVAYGSAGLSILAGVTEPSPMLRPIGR